MNLTLMTYSLLAGLTPVLVLVNSLMISALPQSIQPLQLMSLEATLVDSEPKTLSRAMGLPVKLDSASSQASVINQNGQLFLELNYGLNATAQTPSLMLVLCERAAPDHHFAAEVMLGYLQPIAGLQRYPIPTSVEINRYQSVVIWSPDLEAIMGYAPLAL